MDDVQLLLPDRSHPASTSGPPPNAYNATPAQSIAGAQSNGTNGPAKNDEISMSAGSTGLAMTFSTPSVSGTDARTLEAQYEPGAQPIQEQLTASKPVPPPFVRQPSRTRKADEAFMEEDSTTPEGTDGSSSRRRVIADGSAQKPLAATPSSLEPKSSSSNGQLQPTALALEATGHFRIGESGADADDKSGGPGSTDSGGSGRRSERGDWPDETNPLSREGSGEARGELSGESAEDRSARARQPSNYGKHGKPWAERTLDERAESSESPSGSSSLATGQSSGMESASNDQLPDGKVDGRTRSSSSIPTASSSSLRSEETLQNGATDASLSFNPPFEHERWQRHHQPSVPSGFSSSPASGQGVKLPATGGFIWRGGDEGSSTTVLPWDADTFADSAAVSLPNLGSHLPGGLPRMSVAGTDGFARRPDADGSLLSAAMLPSDPEGQARFWGADGLAAAASLSAGPPMPQTWPPSESSHHPGLFANSAPGVAFPMGLEARKTATLPAGAYPDRFALVSFGPGAGIRGLDAFTDKAGRMGEFGSEAKYAREDDAARGASVGQDLPNGEGTEEGKGKSRWVPAQVMPGSEDRGAMEVVAKGVPYHVPLSAFPVGSSEYLLRS